MSAKKPRKPTELRTSNLYAKCVIDPINDKVVITLTDRGRWTEAGCKIPTPSEMEQLNEWMRKVRAYSHAYNRQKREEECPSE